MKSIATVVTAVAVLSLAAVVLAQSDLTGKWQERTSSGLQIELDLTATETALTGTFTVKGRRLMIVDGKVSKNTFSFQANLGGEPEGFSGELAGDEITLWRDRNRRADAVILQRAPTGLTDTWQGTTRNGLVVVLDLRGTGKTVTGTLTRDGETTTIGDGSVSKDTFTFKATLNGQAEGFTGRLAGDELTVWLDRQGAPGAVSFKRIRN